MGKKSRKNRRDEEEEELYFEEKPLKQQEQEQEQEEKEEEAVSAKREKKKNKKGKKGTVAEEEEQQEESFSSLSKKKNQKGRKVIDDEDDEDENQSVSTASASTVSIPLPSGNQKNKELAKASKKPKKKKKGRRGDDSDEDEDEGIILALQRANEQEQDIEAEEESVSTSISSKSKKKSKKEEKKAKKKGKKADDSDDEDILLALQKANELEEREEEEDDEEDGDDSVSATSTSVPLPVPAKKKKGRKDEKKKSQKGNEEHEEDMGEDDEEEEEEEEDDDDGDNDVSVSTPPEPLPSKKKEKKKEKKSKKGKKEKQGGDSDEEVLGTIDITTPEEKRSEESEKEDVVRVASSVEQLSLSEKKQKPATTSTSAPVATEEAPEETDENDGAKKKSKKEKKEKKEKKLSKLERKLEAAKQQKEEHDRERRQKEKEQQEQEEATKSSEDTSKQPPKKTSRRSAVNDNVDEEAAKMATMFGDEVVSEYSTAAQDSTRQQEQQQLEGLEGKKLSNKEKKRLQKATEQRQREQEYDLALMKASAEGAQFACSQSAVDPSDPQWQNALDVHIPSLSISAHNKELFVDTELHIAHGRRYGLVGPNGAGKSTLLKMISSRELKLPPRIDFLYVEQEVIADDTPAVDAVLKADKERWALVEEEKALLASIEERGGVSTEQLDSRLGEIYEQLAVIGASAAESTARRILFGLGFTVEMQARPTRFFSGGWRMRISLARALFIEPTLLMLDEPTNHLDLNAVIWLDDYLQRWKKTLLVVSHDQDFLNSVCQEIVHLEDKKLVVYRGNYDTFKEQEAIKRRQQQKAWEKQEKRLKEMKSKGQTKQNAEKSLLKSKSREPGARAKKSDTSAQVSSADSKVDLVKRPREYTVRFSFPDIYPLSPPILEVRDVDFRYSPQLPYLFKDVNFGIGLDSRICIVGPNGSGKSTLLKLITDEVKPSSGEVRRNPRLRVGVYNQHFIDRLPMDEDPVSFLRRKFNDETYQSARNMLGRYGLEGHAHTIPIRDLSGGQKARVVLVELSLMAPHILMLDEPTNNLDIESIDALCDALNAYNGGVVLVSHDARLINSIEAQLWVVDDLNCEPWESGFEGYRQHLLKQLEEQMSSIVPGSGERPK